MKKRDARKDYILMAPMALWAIVFVGLSMVYIIAVSFLKSNNAMGFTYQVTGENYAKLLNPTYLRILLSSLSQALCATVCCLAVGYPFGYLMARTKKKTRSVLMILLMAPFWTNALIRIYGWRILLMADGPINLVLTKLGWIQEPLKMLYQEGTVIFGLVYALIPFMILPSYTAAEKLDRSLIDASRDLGARPWQSFITIILPLTTSGILAGCLLVFIPAIGLFFINDLLGGGKLINVGNLIKDVQKTRDLPLMAALGVVLLAVVGLLLYVYQKLGGKSSDLNVF
ncbi:MAG: ABC transporter permease subunit [Clostridia bacterium]|nr:ABC transporter permease subunit [Clostridia bacterium]